MLFLGEEEGQDSRVRGEELEGTLRAPAKMGQGHASLVKMHLALGKDPR